MTIFHPVSIGVGAALALLAAPAAAKDPTDPRQRVGRANAEARVQPDRQGYRNAIQQYAWVEGALFQVYSAPGQVTDIVLQEGEQLVGPGPVASGDTVRWIIGDTVSGAGARRRVHILVKPTRSDIMTNIVFALISQNYLEDAARSVKSGGIAASVRYRELRLLTDMVSGMTDTFTIKLWEELEGMR